MKYHFSMLAMVSNGLHWVANCGDWVAKVATTSPPGCEWSPVVSTELPPVVTELCKALATWWRRIGNLLQHCHNNWRLATRWQLIHNVEIMATLGNFFKQFEKVAKRWRPLTRMATNWQRTGNVLEIIGDGWQCGGNPPQLSVATTLRGSCQQNFG